MNEYIKYSKDLLAPVYCNFFNLILQKGTVPDAWCKGYILPIYKNKGDSHNADNYRGITILSCFGKRFTSILNQRINTFLENSGLLSEEQAGFRKGYGTTDHIFSLKILVDLHLFKKKHLFCAFIDYKKAFDSVDRIALWYKLLQNNIDGNVFRVIHNMYEKAKSCVMSGNDLSGFFGSSVGVRQGENMSLILFSIFLNDLTQFMSKYYDGLNLLLMKFICCLIIKTLKCILSFICFSTQTILLFLLKQHMIFKKHLMLCKGIVICGILR